MPLLLATFSCNFVLKPLFSGQELAPVTCLNNDISSVAALSSDTYLLARKAIVGTTLNPYSTGISGLLLFATMITLNICFPVSSCWPLFLPILDAWLLEFQWYHTSALALAVQLVRWLLNHVLMPILWEDLGIKVVGHNLNQPNCAVKQS